MSGLPVCEIREPGPSGTEHETGRDIVPA